MFCENQPQLSPSNNKKFFKDVLGGNGGCAMVNNLMICQTFSFNKSLKSEIFKATKKILVFQHEIFSRIFFLLFHVS